MTDALASTLSNLSQAHAFHHWMSEQLVPHLKGHVLEAGCGNGNLTPFLAATGLPLSLTDLEPDYLVLRPVQSAFSNIRELFVADLDTEAWATERAAAYDNVVCVNVLEHLQHPEVAVRAFHCVLRPGGVLVVLVPAMPWLYNAIDRHLLHTRRYAQESLRQTLSHPGFRIARLHFFNLLGIPAWWAAGMLGDTTVRRGKIRLFERLLPLARLADRVCQQRAGLSLVAILHKTD